MLYTVSLHDALPISDPGKDCQAGVVLGDRFRNSAPAARIWSGSPSSSAASPAVTVSLPCGLTSTDPSARWIATIVTPLRPRILDATRVIPATALPSSAR